MKRNLMMVAVTFAIALAAFGTRANAGLRMPMPAPMPMLAPMPLPANGCTTHWPAPSDPLSRIAAAKLPALPRESLVYHADIQLEVMTNGVAQLIPGGIGVAYDAARISPLHTHSCDGVDHGESPASTPMHLGQFFVEWGVALTGHCIGEFCDAKRGVRVFLNRIETPMCPGAIPIQQGLHVRLVVGKSAMS